MLEYGTRPILAWKIGGLVSLFFSHLGFWSGNLFLIAPFPDLCLLVPSSSVPPEKASMLLTNHLITG